MGCNYRVKYRGILQSRRTMIVFAIFLICFGLFALYMAFSYKLGRKYFIAYIEAHPHWEDSYHYSKHSGVFGFFLKYQIPVTWTFNSKALQFYLYSFGLILIGLGIGLLATRKWFMPLWIFIVCVALAGLYVFVLTIRIKRWS